MAQGFHPASEQVALINRRDKAGPRRDRPPHRWCYRGTRGELHPSAGTGWHASWPSQTSIVEQDAKWSRRRVRSWAGLTGLTGP